MKRQTAATSWAIAIYLILPLSSLVVGEASFFIWPQIVMLWLRLESFLAFIALIMFPILVFHVLNNIFNRMVESWLRFPSSLAGIILVVCFLILAHVIAAMFALIMGWPLAA